MTGPVGDAQEALAFLRWLRPEGPWVLTSIPPTGDRVTTTDTFGPGQEERMLQWLRERDRRQNVYFMVNPPRGPLVNKAKKENVESMDFLHVDVDPRKGHDMGEERVRALAALEAFVPPPSAVIDSGGGYQGFWRLDEPLYIGGDLGRAAEAEAYNQQLEVVLGGDACHNCDRIMRLPGTVNMPDEKKRKKGRTERLATVVYLAPPGERVYPLADFTAAEKIQSVGGSSKVQISGNLPRLKDLDELPETVTPRTRMLIVQGDDPDDPTRYGSKSEAVWAVICSLVRAGCEDDMIAAVVLDPDFAISEHVLRQGRSVEYAARQIQRAREEVEEPMLRRMNEQHAVIADMGGKCRVISEVMDLSLARPRLRISKQSFDDFRNRYMHIRVQVGTDKDGKAIYKKAGAWWLEHPMRRQFTSLVFAPRREVSDAYNLWQGFACEARPGDGHQSFLDHILKNTCSGNEEHASYLVRWMARAVQQPGEPGEVAVVLRGGKGAGKGTVAQLFGDLWGRHFLHVSAAKHLVGQFNAHLRDCVFLFADEAFFAGDKQHESTLQTLITEGTLVVEGKGLDAEIAPNFTHLMMASNSLWVVPASADERRYFVLDVGEGQKQNSAYFRKLKNDMDHGGRENLLHYLMNLDISEFDVRSVPQTDALREQKLLSLGTSEQWWMERLMDGRITAASPGWAAEVSKDSLQKDYLRYAEDQRVFRRDSPTALGRFLARVLPRGYPVSHQVTADVERVDTDGRSVYRRERVYYYTMPSLEDARARWDEKYGGPYPWPEHREEGLQGELETRQEPY